MKKLVEFEGWIENGAIRLPERISLPDGTAVHVIVSQRRPARIASPRLTNPQHANDFVKIILKKD